MSIYEKTKTGNESKGSEFVTADMEYLIYSFKHFLYIFSRDTFAECALGTIAKNVPCCL